MPREREGSQQRVVTERELLDGTHFFSEGASSGVGQDAKFFVGQEEPRQQLGNVIEQSSPGAVVVISEPLGMGKAFLIETVLQDLNKRPEEYLRTSTYRLERTAQDPNETPRGLIWIEEFDKKMQLSELQDAMRLVDKIVRRRESVIVLSGDYSLRNPALIGLISPEKLVRIDMNVLTPETLKKAFELRLCQALGEKVGEIDIDDLFDEEFLGYLIPNTNPPIATFRSSFAILASMASLSPNSTSPAKFSGDLYSEYRESGGYEFDEKTWHFVSWLHSYIGEHDPNVPMEALKVSDFINLYGVGEISEKEFPKILGYLARRNILKSVGIPYVQDEKNDNPEPYLPSQETFLDAIFNPLPQNTPAEQREIDEIADKKAQIERLIGLLHDGHITQTIFDQKRNEVLGLDDLIKDYIEGNISDQDFKDKRQEIEKKYS